MINSKKIIALGMVALALVLGFVTNITNVEAAEVIAEDVEEETIEENTEDIVEISDEDSDDEIEMEAEEDDTTVDLDDENDGANTIEGPIVVGTDADSITDAIDMASEVGGGKIIVPAGCYSEQLFIETDNITIEAEAGAILDGTGIKPTDDANAMIYIQASGVSVSKLEIRNFKYEGPSESITTTGIEVADGSSNVTIKDCKIHDIGCIYTTVSEDYNGHGIYASGTIKNPTTAINIEGCELYNLNLGQSESLALNGNVSNFTVNNNYIHNCDNIGIDAIGYEQTKEDSENRELDRAREGVIINNKVEYISCDPDVNITYNSKCAAGIYVDGGDHVIIFGNTVSYCDIGIEVATEHPGVAVTAIYVHDNILRENNAFAGIAFGGYDPEKTGWATGCAFEDNYIYNTSGTCFIVQYACSGTNAIYHNTFDAQDSAVEYSESFGEKSAGNVVVKNIYSNKE